jgi:hypothetical protein
MYCRGNRQSALETMGKVAKELEEKKVGLLLKNLRCNAKGVYTLAGPFPVS